MLPEAKHKNPPDYYKRAKVLRGQSSLAEQKLWFGLRQFGKSLGLKFRRQQPIHPYIVDFLCFQLKLVIELDGQSHGHTQSYDQKRTNYLISRGYKVLRYLNHDVMSNLEGVLESLYLEIKNMPHQPLPCPLPQGEGNVVEIADSK